jgi:hypothetical protein
MKQFGMRFLVAAAAATVIAQSALADDEWLETAPSQSASSVAATDYGALAQAFDGFEQSGATLLDDQAMRDTRGELWPFIVSVVGVDLALSSYFWGVYVPYVSGGGSGCITCSYALTVAHH